MWYFDKKKAEVTDKENKNTESLRLFDNPVKSAKRRVNKFKALHDAVYPNRKLVIAPRSTYKFTKK